MSFFCRLLGNAPTVYSLSIPVDQDPFRLALFVPNERKAQVIGSGWPGDEAGLARGKDFLAAKATNTGDKMVPAIIL